MKDIATADASGDFSAVHASIVSCCFFSLNCYSAFLQYTLFVFIRTSKACCNADCVALLKGVVTLLK